MPPLQAPEPVRRLIQTASARRRVALIVAALCVLAMIVMSEHTYQSTRLAMQQIQTAHQLRQTVSSIMRRLAQAESAQRGYIVAGDRQYLEPYKQAQAMLPSLTESLQNQADTIPAVSKDIREFLRALQQRIGEMDLTLKLREAGNGDAAQFVITTNVGLNQMTELDARASRLVEEAQQQVIERRAEMGRLLSVSRLGVAAAALAAFFAFYLFIRQSRALEASAEAQQRALQTERDALELQVRDRTARLTELATYLQQAVEDERAHLARELHDELGALLTAAKLDVARLKSKLPREIPDLADRVKHLTDTLNQGIALKRRIIEDLRPSSLSNLGLVASLEILTREFSDRSGLAVDTSLEAVDLPESSELTVYRLVQEALTNIGKYAEAHHVSVRLANYVHHAEVLVVDDGKGFNVQGIPSQTHGLSGMRHRVEALGGKLDIRSSPGSGTRITASIPRAERMNSAEIADGMVPVSVLSYTAPVATLTPADAQG